MINRTQKIGVILLVVGAVLLPISQVIVNENSPGTQLFSTSKYTKEANGLYVIQLPSTITSTGSTYLNIQWNGNMTKYSLVPISEVGKIAIGNFTQFNVANSSISGNYSSGSFSIIYNSVPRGSYAFVESTEAAQVVYIARTNASEFASVPQGISILSILIGVAAIVQGEYEKRHR